MDIIFFIAGILLIFGKFQVSRNYQISLKNSRILGCIALLPFIIAMIHVRVFPEFPTLNFLIYIAWASYPLTIALGSIFFKKIPNDLRPISKEEKEKVRKKSNKKFFIALGVAIAFMIVFYIFLVANGSL